MPNPSRDAIDAYCRTQGIADGSLIDVSATARKVGLACPVALTVAVSGLLDPADGVSGLDLVELLESAFTAAVIQPITKERSSRVLFWVEHPSGLEKRLRLIASPDDSGRPCITILFPSEHL